MENRQLLTTQKDELFNAVREAGLNLSEFDWTDPTSKPGGGLTIQVSKLVHQASGYFFTFDYKHDPPYRSLVRYTRRSPGAETMLEESFPESWEEQLQVVRQWLGDIRREIEAPDLWGVISEERKLVEAASAPGALNTPFTESEREEVHARLKEIENYLIQSQQFTEEQAEFVRRRLSYLADAAGRIGRLDWKNIAIGVLVTIVLQLGLPSSTAHELFRFVATSLGQLLGGALPLP